MDLDYINESFPIVLSGRDNMDVFNEALEIQKFGDEVIERLRWIEENDPGYSWWEDKELMELFNSLYRCGCILLPREGVDRLRWIALLCIEFSNIYDFSCGNLVIAPDYVEDYELENWNDIYGTDVIEKVIDIRSKVKESGWEAIFETE